MKLIFINYLLIVEIRTEKMGRKVNILFLLLIGVAIIRAAPKVGETSEVSLLQVFMIRYFFGLF